jgi:hypothetical protein
MKKCICLFSLGGLLLLNACQTPNASTPLPDPTPPPASTPAPRVSPVEPSATSVADATSPVAEKMVRLSIENLGRRLKISAEEIRAVMVMPVIWRDASLGCPKPGIDYIRVETPGYSIALAAGGKIYNYHTDEVDRVVLCNSQ